jgi:hypothetical protein
MEVDGGRRLCYGLRLAPTGCNHDTICKAMMQLAPIALVFLAMASGVQSGGSLIGEHVNGLRRVCQYQDPVRGRLAPSLAVEVGMAEPCPFLHPGQPRPRPPEIPSMATLQGEVRTGGQTICNYAYLGVRYSRPISAATRCPLTPHFDE